MNSRQHGSCIYQRKSPLPSEFPFHLCPDCRSLKLTAASFIVPPHHASLGGCDHSTIETLTSRPLAQIRQFALQVCPLCRLIQQDVQAAYPTESELPDVKCEIRIKVHRNVNHHQATNYRVLQVLLRYGIPRNELETPTVELLPVESDEAPGVFTGRRIPPDGLDYSQVKDWMRECQQTHQDTCKHTLDDRYQEIEPYMRVIDVEKRCLTRLPPSSRYGALSYVWGNCNTTEAFATLRSNIAKLTPPGSLDAVLASSPSAVSNAMDFVRNIGERYLWIDRICIVQDDDEEKQNIIDKMNLVYGNAFFTLFAGTGKDANAGLPGVRPKSRGCQQLVENIGPGIDLMAPLNLETLMTSIWASRGWTYQEFFFAKRRFIFIGGQVVYSCQQGNRREDVTTPHLTVTQKFLMSAPTDWQPPLTLSKLRPVQQRSSFMEYVQAFSKRQLSFDSDALNAFAGIVDFMTNDLYFKTHFGLPLATLDLDILWQPCHFLQRRPGFPSWSWAGWKGPILMARAGETLMPGIQHIRKRYTARTAFLARLFFVPFYTFTQDQQCFMLTSVDMNRFCRSNYADPMNLYREMTIRDHESALEALRAPITPAHPPGLYPPVAREKNCSFDPRSATLMPVLAQLNSPLAKYIVSARPPANVKARLTSQTLLLHTLTTRIHVSTLDPQGSRCKPTPSPKPLLSTTPCIHFYDEHGTSIGLGWLCEEAAYNRLAKISEESGDRERPARRPQVEIAFVSGPIRGNWRHKDEWYLESGLLGIRSFTDSLMLRWGLELDQKTPSQMARNTRPSELDAILGEKPWEGISLNADEEDDKAKDDKLMYCQVMLLCNVDSRPGGSEFDNRDSKDDPWQVKERIGLGEIREDVVADLRGIAWRDVFLA